MSNSSTQILKFQNLLKSRKSKNFNNIAKIYENWGNFFFFDILMKKTLKIDIKI